MKFISRSGEHSETTQLIYALVVIILVPMAIAANTLYLLRSFQRDADFELNNKALLVQSAIAVQTKKFIDEPDVYRTEIIEVARQLNDIKAIQVFKKDTDNFVSLAATSERSQSYADRVLNELAWSGNQAYSKQINAAFEPGIFERVWLVASPITNASGNKFGVMNLYLSAAQVDALTARTARDSLVILGITIFIVLLLLLNHLRFYETALLFQKLRDVDKLKDDFISVASHELRTPMTIIYDYAQLILKDPATATSDNLKKWTTIIKESSERLRTLIADMLDVSRIEQNRISITSTDLDLRDVVRKVIEEHKTLAQSKGLTLNYEESPSPLTITCDKDKMRQVLTNLVGNAIKYTEAGKVTVYHQLKNKFVKTFVKDTGIGISAEDRARLFGKFVRIQNEKTQNVTGTGLGLWITKQLVERMGGKITVDSIENQGSQFAVSFRLKS